MMLEKENLEHSRPALSLRWKEDLLFLASVCFMKSGDERKRLPRERVQQAPSGRVRSPSLPSGHMGNGAE